MPAFAASTLQARPQVSRYQEHERSPALPLLEELSPGIVKIPYAGTTLTGAGGTGPYTFTKLSATDAPGITFSAAGGSLSGTPTAVGSYAYTFRVTDSLAAFADRAYTLVVEPPGRREVATPNCPAANTTTPSR